MPQYGLSFLEAAIQPDDLTVASGATLVVDMGACSAFVPYFASGTATMTPCNAAGTTIPGASAVSLTTATLTNRVSRYAKFAPSGATLTICRI